LCAGFPHIRQVELSLRLNIQHNLLLYALCLFPLALNWYGFKYFIASPVVSDSGFSNPRPFKNNDLLTRHKRNALLCG